MAEEEGIRVGLTAEATERVRPAETAKNVGSGGLRVYATPAMVRFVERSCFQLLQPLLSEGQTSVGVEIHVWHLAPTPVDKEVHLRAEITSVQENRVDFRVELRDDMEAVGRAEHSRAIIDVARFLERVRSKSEQLH
jgi:fluoroacetyl-CoA thioesterase